MNITTDRLRRFTIGLIKDSISWTPDPLDESMMRTLVSCLLVAESEELEEGDFMRVRDLLIKGGLNTSPQLSQDDLVADAVRESISGFIG